MVYPQNSFPKLRNGDKMERTTNKEEENRSQNPINDLLPPPRTVNSCTKFSWAQEKEKKEKMTLLSSKLLSIIPWWCTLKREMFIIRFLEGILWDRCLILLGSPQIDSPWENHSELRISLTYTSSIQWKSVMSSVSLPKWPTPMKTFWFLMSKPMFSILPQK